MISCRHMDQFVIVIEDEEKIQESLYKVLKKINPLLKIRYFSKLDAFSAWIGLVIKDGPLALETAGTRWKDDAEVETIAPDKRLNLIICKDEILGSRSMSLINKTTELLLRKKLCTEEEKTAVIITAFDQATFDLKVIEEKFINNVIYKPFDNIILEEHLRYAIIGRKKPKDDTLKSSKVSAQVEMVKDIPVAGFSDLGFLTISDRLLKVGELGKYYADEFKAGNLKSTMARCVKCEPDPDRKEIFLCWMEYFALENEQIKKFRKEIPMEYPTALIEKPKHPLKLNIVYFDAYSDSEFPSSVKRFFPEVNILTYHKWDDFEFDYNPEKSELIVEKDLPGENDFIIHLDPTGHYFLEFGEIPEGENLFGEIVNVIKSKDFQSLLDVESKKKWLEVYKNQKVNLGTEPTLVVQNNGKKYIFKLLSFKKDQTKTNVPAIELKLAKLASFEKTDFLKRMTPLMKNIDLVVGNDAFFKSCLKKNYYEKETKILISKDYLSDADERYWSQFVKDILYMPIDRSYLAKKIFITFSDAKSWDKQQFIPRLKEIQTALQIQIDEISEGGLFLKYHRPIPIGSFRRFYLWTPNETELMDYHANCNYTEELKEQKGTFVHHFVFFGMKDLYLKNIRLWVRDNYIQNKSKNE